MCWPNSLTRRYSMNLGPRKMQISIAAMPAISTSPIEQLLQGHGHALEAGRARALDQDRVAGFELGGEQLGRLLGRANEVIRTVVAGGLTDTDEEIDAAGAGALTDLAVVAGGAGAELGHLAQNRDP